jgi:hypothetical protein
VTVTYDGSDTVTSRSYTTLPDNSARRRLCPTRGVGRQGRPGSTRPDEECDHSLGLPDDQPIFWSPARMSRVSEANPQDAKRP